MYTMYRISRDIGICVLLTTTYLLLLTTTYYYLLLLWSWSTISRALACTETWSASGQLALACTVRPGVHLASWHWPALETWSASGQVELIGTGDLD